MSKGDARASVKRGDGDPRPVREGDPRAQRENDRRDRATDLNSISVSLWVRLLETHNLMLSEVRRRLSAQSTLPRFDLLVNLEREDGQTLAALSRRMLVTAGNLTGLVDRAERDGYVERKSDAQDRRVSRVCLTSKGRELVRSLLPLHAAHVHELLSGLDGADRRELRRLLGKLRGTLAAQAEENPHEDQED